MTLFLVLILFVYVLTLVSLIRGFDRIRTFHPKATVPKTFFSIVVPFRNERAHLPTLLESIKNLHYPIALFELILVDDFSEDDSVRQIYNWRMENGEFQTTLLENIRLSNSPKKDAISRAIPIVQQEWILTTDADCVVPTEWLKTLDAYIQEHEVSMLVGAVTYEAKKSFLHQFQQLDLTSLQGATIGSFGMGLGFLCNGANFGYTKTMFQRLHGFKRINSMASGDDVLLLQKAMHICPKEVHYVKSKQTIVRTFPLNSWSQVMQQRSRWASKTSAYKSVFGKDLAVIVFAGNLALIVSFVLLVFRPQVTAMKDSPWLTLTFLFLTKFTVDTILLYKTNRFFKKKRLRYLLTASVLYPFFAFWVALLSWFGNYEWKGRMFKN